MALFTYGPHHYKSKADAEADIRKVRGRGTEMLSRLNVPRGQLVKVMLTLDANKLTHLMATHHPMYRAKVRKIGGKVTYWAFRQNPRSEAVDAQVVAVGPIGFAVMSTVMPFRRFDPIRMWLDAMRSMISDQTRDFLKGIDYPLECSVTGSSLRIEVDHYPRSFTDIALSFLEQHLGGDMKIVLSHYTLEDHYSFFRDTDCAADDGWFADDQLVREWQEFHRLHATYRLLTGSQNASEGKKVKAEQADRLTAMRALIGTKIPAA